ncbi:MAG: response regulator [Gammaproteobacteria bacterium]|jgi:DNA-binding NarL/FixJ family response regulator|nr:response regulator [Gammaproteobacteria bacterium]
MAVPQSTRSRIVLVDDHPVARAGLRRLIEEEPDLTVCAETGSVRDAVAVIQDASPDLAIIDLSLEDGSGIELIKRLKTHVSGLKMLVFSMHDEALFAERAVNAGALGYANKHQRIEQILDAIRTVLAGRVYLSETMVERLVNGFAKKKDAGSSGIEDLSDRELEVFGLIGQGLSTSQIATRLHLSVKTVETHRDKIKRKLQLASGGELVRHAVEWQMSQA